MNNDIRISCSFPEHYKTKKLIAIAGNAAPFSLISLWVYAARNKPDGFLDNMDNFDIEIAANWNGQSNLFFDALVKCKFLEVADEGYYLHDWQVHQPYASSAEERSDKARFAILARHNRDMHTKLKEQGVNGLSVAEYKKYTKRIRPENDSNTKTYKNLTPSPLPSPLPYPVPLPAPEPLPSPKDNNTPAFFDKKASDDLPFAYECEKKEPVVKKSQSMFEEFWRAYPKKTGKKKVAGIYERLISRGEVTHDELIDGISAYKKSETVKKGFIKNPETWLNGGCWADEHTANDEESEWWGNDEIEQQIEDQLWIDDPVGMQRQQDAAKAAAAIAKKMAEEKKEQAKKAQEALK